MVAPVRRAARVCGATSPSFFACTVDVDEHGRHVGDHVSKSGCMIADRWSNDNERENVRERQA